MPSLVKLTVIHKWSVVALKCKNFKFNRCATMRVTYLMNVLIYFRPKNIYTSKYTWSFLFYLCLYRFQYLYLLIFVFIALSLLVKTAKDPSPFSCFFFELVENKIGFTVYFYLFSFSLLCYCMWKCKRSFSFLF